MEVAKLPVIELIHPDKLIPYAHNTKAHSPDHIQDVAESIVENGWTQPVVIDVDNVIVAGHGRTLAAISLNLTQVPCVRVSHLEAEKVRAYRLKDNRSNESPWLIDEVRFELAGLKSAGINLDHTGFKMPDLGQFLNTGKVPGGLFGPWWIGNALIDGGEAVGSQELDPGEFSEFEHRCPKCGFEFDQADLKSPEQGDGSVDPEST
jgi:hypothetical protein